MPEPTTTTTATAWAVAAGLMASFLAAIGVTWVHIFWAASGAFVGGGFFEHRLGRWRAIMTFLLSALLAAKAGIIGAAWAGPIGSLPPAEVAQAAGGLFGIMFQPIAAALVKMAPALMRLRLGLQESDK